METTTTHEAVSGTRWRRESEGFESESGEEGRNVQEVGECSGKLRRASVCLSVCVGACVRVRACRYGCDMGVCSCCARLGIPRSFNLLYNEAVR